MPKGPQGQKRKADVSGNAVHIGDTAIDMADDSFGSAAKRLRCNDDKNRFEAKLGNIAMAKPKGTAKPK